MKKAVWLGVSLTAILGLNHSLAAQAQETVDLGESIDISEIDCRLMLQMTSEEREFTLLYFHGFMSGQANDTSLNDLELGQATDEIVNTCIDNPENSLISVFEQYR